MYVETATWTSKVRESASAILHTEFQEISRRWRMYYYIYGGFKHDTVFQPRFLFPKERQTEIEQFSRSAVHSSTVQQFCR